MTNTIVLMQEIIKVVLISFLISGCATAKLKTSKVDFVSNCFETNGFYYTIPNKNNNHQALCYIFYKNGVLFGGFSVGSSENEIKEFLNNDMRVQIARELAYSWGVFQVDHDSLIIEKWISSDEFGGYPTIKYYGKVIDNKKITLNIPIVYSTLKSSMEFKPDTLFYCPFEAKPDSTNKFIKSTIKS